MVSICSYFPDKKKFESGVDFEFTWTDYCRLKRYRTLGSRDSLSGYEQIFYCNGIRNYFSNDGRLENIFLLSVAGNITDSITISNMAAKNLRNTT